MESFEKKIKQIKNRRLFIAIFILIIALVMLVLSIIAMIPKDIEYKEFNKKEKLSNYAKTTINYLIGPIVEVKDTKNESTILGYYIAVGNDENLFIIRLNKDNIEIPILGKDINQEEVDTLQDKEVYGSVELTSRSLRDILYNRLNTVFNQNIVNDDSYDKVLGGYYLDTVPDEKNEGIKLLIISIFFAIIGFLYILVNKRIRTNVNRSIMELKAKGKLEEVIKDFESGQLINYKQLKVYVSPKYIFNYYSGLDVVALKDIKEVTISKRNIGSYDRNKYIIITTKGNKDYYIAPMSKKKQKVEFNELLTKIKNSIE